MNKQKMEILKNCKVQVTNGALVKHLSRSTFTTGHHINAIKFFFCSEMVGSLCYLHLFLGCC